MKKEIDRDGRILYKFAHSTAKGSNAYIHKTLSGKNIENKEGLRNALTAIAKKHSLIDPTIKIYDALFFLFFHMPKSLAPAALIESIENNISSFAQWDTDYVYTGVDDLQEHFVRKDLQHWGYDYDKG